MKYDTSSVLFFFSERKMTHWNQPALIEIKKSGADNQDELQSGLVSCSEQTREQLS